MFGHQDDDESKKKDKNTPAEDDNQANDVLTDTPHSFTPAGADTDADKTTGNTDDKDLPVAAANGDSAKPEKNQDDSWDHPGEPIEDDDKGGSSQISDIIISPLGDRGTPAPPLHGTSESFKNFSNDDNSADELIDIKRKALTELTPLVDHLDQTPEDKFRTTMMMIQASDNQSLIKQAYEAADKITDEKIRAQALLDIVNEINYFTQHPDN